MVEPKRDDKSEQAARSEVNEQEATHLLRLERQEFLTKLVTPKNLIGLLSLYLLLIGTLSAFGVFSFYIGHKITQQIIFFICLILILSMPIGAIWYFRHAFNNSRISKFLARLGNKRLFRITSLALYAYMVADAIYSFPKHPRFSLATIVVYLTFFLASAGLWVWGTIESRISAVIGLIRDVIEIIKDIRNMALRIDEFVDFTARSQVESSQITTHALRTVNNAVQKLEMRITNALQLEVGEKENPKT